MCQTHLYISKLYLLQGYLLLPENGVIKSEIIDSN